MPRKKKYLARLAFEVQFEAASPNKAVETATKIVDELATLVFLGGLPVVAHSGAMIARLSASSSVATPDPEKEQGRA